VAKDLPPSTQLLYSSTGQQVSEYLDLPVWGPKELTPPVNVVALHTGTAPAVGAGLLFTISLQALLAEELPTGQVLPGLHGYLQTDDALQTVHGTTDELEVLSRSHHL